VGSPSTTFPPEDTYYVEATGYSPSGKVRKVGMLAKVSQSRWGHAAFGNNKVVLKSGCYTDSFNSDNPTGGADHSLASVATNNPKDGIKIEDHESVVVGWSGSIDTSGKRKKKKDKGDAKLVAEANVQGPPGSTEKAVVKGDGKAQRSYNNFVTATSIANQEPVNMPAVPAEVAPPSDITTIEGAVIDPLVSSLPSVVPVTTSLLPPGAYHSLNVGAGGVAVLDVSGEPPGSEVRYVFHGINLNGGALQVLQPPGDPVTVKVYIDTGDGKDKSAGVQMTGSSIINKEQKPINLQFLIAGKGENNLEGHDDLKDGLTPTAYYVAYAPEGKINVKRGQIFGSVVADEVKLEGESLLDPDKAPAVIHFDTTLLEDTSNPPIINILSIRNY